LTVPENRKDPIASPFDELAAELADVVFQDRVVTRNDLTHRFAVFFPLASRSFDVRKKKYLHDAKSTLGDAVDGANFISVVVQAASFSRAFEDFAPAFRRNTGLARSGSTRFNRERVQKCLLTAPGFCFSSPRYPFPPLLAPEAKSEALAPAALAEPAARLEAAVEAAAARVAAAARGELGLGAAVEPERVVPKAAPGESGEKARAVRGAPLPARALVELGAAWQVALAAAAPEVAAPVAAAPVAAGALPPAAVGVAAPGGAAALAETQAARAAQRPALTMWEHRARARARARDWTFAAASPTLKTASRKTSCPV
jgi:hypothetical protein